MSQLIGPVGAGPTDPYYTSNQYDQEQQKFQAAQQEEDKKRQKQEGQVGPATVNPLAGIQQAIGGFDAGEAVTGTIDAVFGTQTQDAYRQKKQQDQQLLQRANTQIQQDTGFGAEAIRVAADVGVGAVEGTLNTLDVTGDILKAGAINLTGGKVQANRRSV